jgi:uncharacterized protein with ParB-like and HNH nuclease domain
MNEIRGDAKTIRQLLSSAKYAIDYYQRDYKWTTKQVQELLDDLSDKFLEDYQPGEDRSQVEKYGHYFLGSIIISDRDGQKFIIDGQQRLTTVTLLLIYLHNLQSDRSDQVAISELIFSEKFARRSFNIDVPDRTPCMEALFTQTTFDETKSNESVRNMLLRYDDIDDLFPDNLKDAALPYFIDWLIENVHLVEITAYSDEDAYSIFETMNDRGLSLSPTDMLKGYLLANIIDETKRKSATDIWKTWMGTLAEIDKEAGSDCIKAWLRSKHATSIRERKRNSKPQDFDRIGTEFHRWVRENDELLRLTNSGGFSHFIETDFTFFARQYEMLVTASRTFTAGLEAVYYNGRNNFTLQFPLLLAPIASNESDTDIKRKFNVVASYVDILIARRIWNYRSIDYSTMQYAMFLVMRELRGKSLQDVAIFLAQQLSSDKETFVSNNRLRLHGGNGRQIHTLLARMTEFVEVESGMKSRFSDYMVRSGKGAYEVEHIWANLPERYKVEFANPADFDEHRNRLGGLLLLPKTFNASYGSLPYGKKHEHYNAQNLLARTLHPLAYKHNPGFLRLIERTALGFRPVELFGVNELNQRQDLYGSLAEVIWSPDRLAKAASSA